MGLYLSTQLDWELGESGRCTLAKSQRNSEALYMLYFELSVIYGEWFSLQDLTFPENNDAKTEYSLLLTTPFKSPLRFTTNADIADLLGVAHSQHRLHALLIQQRRAEELTADKQEYVTTATSKAHVHRRERLAKRASITGLDSTDSATLWSRVPDTFWALYKLADDATAVSSAEKVHVRADDAARLPLAGTTSEGLGGLHKNELAPAYTLKEDRQDNFVCTAWTLQHVVHHIAFVMSMANSELMLNASMTVPANTVDAVHAVRMGLAKAYLFMDKDHMSFPCVSTPSLHELLLKEVTSVIESLINDAPQHTPAGCIDTVIYRAWQRTLAGSTWKPDIMSASSASGFSAKGSLLRKRVSSARVAGIDTDTMDSMKGIASLALQQLNTVLVDPGSLVTEGAQAPASLHARKSQARPSRKSDDKSKRGDLGTTSADRGSMCMSVRSQASEAPLGSPLFSQESDISESEHEAETSVQSVRHEPPQSHDDEDTGFIHCRMDEPKAQSPPPQPSHRDRRKTPPAMMDVTGDLRALAPSEIASALLTQNQREELEDVSEAERARDLAKWRNQSNSQMGLLSEALDKPSLASHVGRGGQKGKWHNYEPGSGETVHQRRRAQRAERGRQDEEDWQRECDEDSDDEDFKNYHPDMARRRGDPMRFHLLGTCSANSLMLRSAAATPALVHRTTVASATRVSVDRLSAVQRLVLTMIWQQVECTLLAAQSLLQHTLRGKLTLTQVETELDALEALTEEDVPLTALAREVELPPWRQASGELVLVQCSLTDSILRVKATTEGWVLLSCTNNMPPRGITSAPPPLGLLDSDGSNEIGTTSSGCYTSLTSLLRDFSAAFREFDLEGHAQRITQLAQRESQAPAAKPGSPVAERRMSPRFVQSLSSQNLPRPPSRFTAPRRPVRRRSNMPKKPAALQQKELFVERERKKREVVMELRRYQASPQPDDRSDMSDMSASDEDTLAGGISILEYGPDRKAIKAPEQPKPKRELSVEARPAVRVDEAKASIDGGSSSDDSDFRETISGIARRAPASVRNYNAYLLDDVLAHFIVSDLLSHGPLPEQNVAQLQPLADRQAVGSLAFIPGIAPASVKKAESTLAPQWVTFLQANTKQARTLFALRSMLEADLSIPANQAALFRNNGFDSLAQIVARRVDYRLRISAARALLVCCQNTSAAKIMWEDVVPRLTEALLSSHPQQKNEPQSGICLKSWRLSHLAAEAATSPELRSVGDQKCSHTELITVVSFTLASLVISVAKARNLARSLDMEAAAVALLERYHRTPCEAVRVSLFYLLRSLSAKPRGCRKKRKAKCAQGLDVQTILLLKSRPSVREVQAVAGFICSRAYDTHFLNLIGSQHVLRHLLKPFFELRDALSHSHLTLAYGNVPSARYSVFDDVQRLPRGMASVRETEAAKDEPHDTFLGNFFTFIAIVFAVEECMKAGETASQVSSSAFAQLVDMQLTLARRMLGADVEMTGALEVFPDLAALAQTFDHTTCDEFVYSLLLLSGLTGVLANIAMHDTQHRNHLNSHELLVTTMCRLVTLPPVGSRNGGELGAPKVARISVSVKSKAAIFVSRLAEMPCPNPVIARYAASFLEEIHDTEVSSVAAALCRTLRCGVATQRPQRATMRSFLLRKGNLGVLWQALQSYSRVRAEAAACLAAMVHPGEENIATAGLPCDKMTEGFLSCLGDRLQLLVRYLNPEDPINALSDKENYEEVQVGLCDVVAHVSHFTNAQGLLETQGLLPMVLRLCRENKSPRLLASAVHCLWLCAEAMPEQVAEGGALQVLADKLCNGNKAADLYIVLTVKVLVSTQPHCYATCIQTGVVSFLVQLLGSSDPVLQSNVAAALSLIRRSQQAKARHRASLKPTFQPYT